MSQSVAAEIEDLRRQIRHHDRLYYQEAQPEIPDHEYDALMRRLVELEQEHPELDEPDSPSHKVGGAPIDEFRTVQHRVPMLSIENVYTEPELREFGEKVTRHLKADSGEWLSEYKVDGVALSLIYEGGKLVRAVTRGDGRRGDDVTHNARTMRGVPLRLEGENVPAEFEIRGEAFISNTDFAHLRSLQVERGEEPFKNSRNATAGAIKLLDPKICAERKIRFFAHSVGWLEGVGFSKQTDLLAAVRSWGIPTVPKMNHYPSFAAACDALPALMEDLHSLDFEVDGIVLKVNDFALREKLGSTSKAPRWIVAFKWEKYEATTQIREIRIQVGKTGTLTPVAEMEPVSIAGTTVSRASLHNADEIERLGVQLHDWVVVEKAGKIIPHVVRVEEHRRDGTQKPYLFPQQCPRCETPVVRDENGVYIRCPNPACPAQLQESVRFFASRAAMDIEGLGVKLIEQLVHEGLVRSYADIYRLVDKRDQILELERMGEKSVDNLIVGIAESRKQPLWRLITALNIRHVGTRTAQILVDAFGSLDEIIAQSEEALAETNEIGPVSAKSIYEFFHSDYGRNVVEELRGLGLNFGSKEDRVLAPPAGPLAGQTIVVTGKLEQMTREEIEEFIRSQGGNPGSSVSKKTSLLVAGEDAGSKLAKAQQLGVRVMTEAEFLAMCQA